jgi:OST-HTH/LOTUS domain
MLLVLWIFAVVGAVHFASRGMQLLAVWLPGVLTVRSKAWRVLASSTTVPTIRHRAIAVAIEEVVNRAVFSLQRHLPNGWIKRARIQWVRRPSVAQLREGDIIIRVAADADPDTNLLQSLYTYFYTALFPNCRDLLPDVLISGIALAITRGSIEHSLPYLLADFDNKLVQRVATEREGVLDQFADCVRLNEYGFLTGPYVRELDHAATGARFTADRDGIPNVAAEITQHMLGFQPLVRLNKPEREWYYEGIGTAYGILLVSKPRETRPGIDAYIRRGQLCVQRGISRLYVIGRNEERDFVYADALLTIRQFKGVEVFPLLRDYRGDLNGVGALLGLDEMLSKLDLAQRPLNGHNVDRSQQVPDQLQQDRTPGDATSGAAHEISNIVEDLIVEMAYYPGAWIPMAKFGAALRRKIPGFTPEQYGAETLTSVLKQVPRIEFDDRGAGSVYLRLREETRSERVDVNARIVDIVRRYAREDGWIFLGKLGHYLKVEAPDFHFARFGASSLGEYISSIPELETEKRGERNLHMYVRVSSR